MKFLKSFIFLSCLSLSFTGLHDFHLSKTSIKYKADKQVIQISTHIFIDDLELALLDNDVDSLYIGTEKEVVEADQFIHQYLDGVLFVHCGQDTFHSTFVGKELSEDIMAVWAYLEITDVPSCAEFTITNKIFQRQFDDQKNILTFTPEGGKKGYFIFDKRDVRKSFKTQ